MSKDDSFLPVKMEKLELQPESRNGCKLSTDITERNPFFRRRSQSLKSRQATLNPCMCSGIKRSSKALMNSKNYRTKLLKEPVLQYIHKCSSDDTTSKHFNLVSLSQIRKPTKQQLEQNDFTFDLSTLSREIQRRGINDSTASNNNNNNIQNPGSSCSQQALNPPCDVTMDELASYFETLVHIPKKMSSMAEMMYI